MGLRDVSPSPCVRVCHTVGVGHLGTSAPLWAPDSHMWGMRWACLGNPWPLSLFLGASRSSHAFM